MKYNKQNKNDILQVVGDVTEYLLLNVQMKKFIYVKKETFQKLEMPVISLRSAKIKFYAGSRASAKELAKQVPSRYFPQSLGDALSAISGLVEDLKAMCKGGKLIAKACVVVGQGDPSSIDKLSSVFPLLLDVVLQVFSARESASPITIGILLFKIALAFRGLSQVFIPQSIEGLIFSLISLSFPNPVVEAFKRVSMFTNFKVLEDLGGLHRVILAVDEYLRSLIMAIFPSSAHIILPYCEWGRHHIIIHKIKQLISRSNKDSKEFMREDFRKEIFTLSEDVRKCDVLQEWARSNGAVSSHLSKLHWLEKVALNYENTVRVEPVCFAFEGPPACGKSRTLTQLLKVQQMSVYSHVTKAAGDGKDFWDAYNNEEIMVCDDWGQLGPSQFRNLINLVAPVKLPLDCAEAKLKDTKFFNSHSIFFTTNRFKYINNLTKQDMITDITALWRRVFLFEWKDDGVHLQHFNVNLERWIPGVPSYMSTPKLPTVCSGTQLELVAWMRAWHLALLKQKQKESRETSDLINIEEAHNLASALLEGEEVYLDAQNLRREPDLISTVEEVIDGWTMPATVAPFQFENNNTSTGLSMFLELPKLMASQILEYSSLFKVLMGVFGFAIAWVLCKTWRTSEQRFEAQSSLLVKQQAVLHASTSCSFVQKQVKFVKLHGRSTNTIIGLISGHVIITVNHGVADDEGFLTVFQGDPSDNLRILDHVPYTVTLRQENMDLALLEIPSCVVVPFKKLDRFFGASMKNKGLSFLHPSGIVGLDGKTSSGTGVYSVKGVDIRPDAGLVYSGLQAEGFCGSILFCENKGIIGYHVAGDPVSNKGFAQILSEDKAVALAGYLNGDRNVSKYDIKSAFESGCKISANFHSSNPTKTKFVKSPLYGVFPVLKEPVDPGVNGPHTVKDSLKEALSSVETVVPSELAVCDSLLDTVFVPFFPITEREVIAGGEGITPMTKDTATGIGLEERSVYVDFPQARLTEEGRSLIDGFKEKVFSGTLDVEDVVSKEAVKDELRGLHKKRFPRTFRVVPFHMNFLLKQYTAQLAKHFCENKWNTGIMLNCNPYKDFSKIHTSLSGYNLLALDVKFWDKKMLPQIMNRVSEAILYYFKGEEEEKEVLAAILYNIMQNYVAANDDTLWLTHSLASGCWLTTLFNSLIQLCYVRIWHHRTTGGSVSQFRKDLKLFILGDDILCGSRVKELNAFSMRDFYKSIGLDATSSTKGEILTEYETWETVTFLKRYFVFHRRLGKVVGVLADETLYSSISWVDSSKDIDQVILDKINQFQLEAFLHPRGEVLVRTLRHRCEQEGIDAVWHPDSYFISLFRNDEVSYVSGDGVFLC